MIGSFGSIVFETSSVQARTFNRFSRSSSAAFSEHAVLDGKPVLEHTGAGLDSISFNIHLSTVLGLNPARELSKLRAILSSGDPQKLLINSRVLGYFVLEQLNESWTRLDSEGHLISADLSLELKEFVHGN